MIARLKGKADWAAGGADAGLATGMEHLVTPVTNLCARRTLFKAQFLR